MEAEGDGVCIGISGIAGSTDASVADEYHVISDSGQSSDTFSQCSADHIGIDRTDRNLVPVRDRIPHTPGAGGRESSKSTALPGGSRNRGPGNQQPYDDCHTNSASKGVGRL